MVDMPNETSQQVAVCFLTDKPRLKTITLEWPLAFDGHEYREITLRRLSTKEIDDFVATIRALPEDKPFRFPLFYSESGALIPDEVWDALDDDDRVKLNEASFDFLPGRWKRTPIPTDPTPSISDPSTADTGASSSAGPQAVAAQPTT